MDEGMSFVKAHTGILQPEVIDGTCDGQNPPLHHDMMATAMYDSNIA